MAYKLKILVTGGAGNIGSALVKKLISNKFHFVVVIDDLSTGSIEKLPKLNEENFKFVKANVNNLSEIDSVFYSFNFDFVFHLAAVVGVNTPPLRSCQI